MENLKDILVVTGANGVSGGKPGGAKLWTARFAILAWKEIGCKIVIEERNLSQKVNDEKLRELQEQIRENNVYRLRITDDGNNFELQEFIGEAKDSELESFLAEQIKPVYFPDERFGQFEFNRSVGWFECKTDWLGQNIGLSIESDEAGMKEMLETVYILFDNQTEWDKKIRVFACGELLELKNDSWLDEDEKELTSEMFKKRIVLQSINISEDGEFIFWFDDDGIFWGHSIYVSGNLAEGLSEAEIAG